MKYIISPNIALRSWKLVPFAYYIKGVREAQKLSREDFAFLCECDGSTDVQPSELSKSLEERGFIKEAKEGDSLSEWQQPRFHFNRYFPAANWSITGKCNYNCKHCFMAADNAHLMREFSREEWTRLIEDFDKCGVQTITLTGGEPLLHPDFLDIMREICRRGMTVMDLNTNGSLITPEILDEFRKMGASPRIKISYDCIGHHDWMRGKEGAEEEAMRAIDLCLEKGFETMVQTCIHKYNLDTLYDTVELMAKKGVNRMRIIRTSEAPRWAENAGDACLGIEEYYNICMDLAEKYAASGLQMEIDLWQFMEIYPKERVFHVRPSAVYGCENEKYMKRPVCGGNRGTIGKNSDGSVVPCNQLAGFFEKHGYDLGNVKNGLQPLLTSGKYLDTVTCPVSKIYEHSEKCRNCGYFSHCRGGCRAISMAFTNDYLEADPAKCIFFEKGYLKRLYELYDRVAESSGIKYRDMEPGNVELLKLRQ